ncbi:DUF397 domain-containing protein [Catellatospora citrea]|uniref:DUF397 domain-containing protein n=1 Tax=Catellatospora citrea TaxID=53366 RepID=A0A8J3K2J4_9ACTN|nr:DUF397 domain-containing protein [Catellatospora citrea]RKE07400.1 uncharacterized protein DUF397 [Catellatospora citrea]GIF95556.1 hypothetical protein Cci01nite_06500 [Catellatospora citrea]
MSNLESHVNWRRSSRCDTGACVEVAQFGPEVGVRDAKDPQGPVLRFTRQEFAAFIAGVRAGDFVAD